SSGADSAATGEHTAASFDCQHASTHIERMICANPNLSALDDRMSRLYAEAEQSKAGEQRRAEQRAWWARRNQCGDAACIAELYRRRIAQLQSFAPGRENPDTGDYRPPSEFDISDNPNTHEAASALARRLFAATIQPADWEDAKKLYRIARLLVPSQESGRYLTPYGSWIGADEFEIARTRRRFAEEFTPRV